MLSVAIIARNEERHIGGALASVAGLADEVLVLDAQSGDRTADIARERGALVVVEPWRGFPAQRNRALELCGGDWVLFLDADERVTEELAAEIRDKVTGWQGDKGTRDKGQGTGGRELTVESQTSRLNTQNSQLSGYWVPRRNLFFGRPLRGGGWYPDRQLRLLRRAAARYDEAVTIHEVAALDGPAGELQGHLLHLNIERLDELWRKQTAYAIQEAQTLHRAGRRARARNFVGAPLREFHRRFVALGGWRDGALGLFLCATLACFEIVKFVHLRGLEKAGRVSGEGSTLP